MIPPNTKIHKLFTWLAWAAIFSAIALLILIAIWLFRPYEVAEVKQPFLVLNANKTVAINEKLQLRLVIDKKLAVRPKSTTSIRCESGNLVTLASTLPENLPVGKYTVDVDAALLPPKFTIGDVCQYVAVQEWQVNPIRTITGTYYSEYFTISE